MGQKSGQVTSSNYAMTQYLISVISNNGIREESSKKAVNCDFCV